MKILKQLLLTNTTSKKINDIIFQMNGMILAGILDSIIRNRNDVRIFILGNAVEGIEFSPLFAFFDLTLPYNNDIKLFKDNTILLQFMNNEEFRKERESTLIGKLMKRY